MLHLKNIANKDKQTKTLLELKKENESLRVALIDKDILIKHQSSKIKTLHEEIGLKTWLVAGIDFAMTLVLLFGAAIYYKSASSGSATSKKDLPNTKAPGIMEIDANTTEYPLIIDIIGDNKYTIKGTVFNSQKALIQRLDELKATGEIKRNKQSAINNKANQEVIEWLDNNTSYQGTIK